MKSATTSAMKGHTLKAVTAVLALATTILVSTALVPRALVPAARAEDQSSTLNPGFVPNTGRINPGQAAQPWSTAPALRVLVDVLGDGVLHELPEDR